MSRSTADHCAHFGDSLPHSRPVPPIRPCSLCFSRSSLPCLGRPMRAQSRPPRHLRAASTREGHQPPTYARRQSASRTDPLDALGRRLAMRSPPGAGRGGCRSLRSILTGMVVGGDHSRRNAVQLGGSGGSSGGSRGASRGGEIRRESVRVSAMLAVERAAAGREAAGAVCREGQRMCGGRAGATRSCARFFAHVEAWVVHVGFAAHPAGM